MNEQKELSKHEPQIQTRIGKVDWFCKIKGYGFISYNHKHFFVHYNDIKGPGFQILQEGQYVRFRPEIGPRGGVARDVKPKIIKTCLK